MSYHNSTVDREAHVCKLLASIRAFCRSLSAEHSKVVQHKQGQPFLELAIISCQLCVQAWRVAHPPVRGHTLCGTRPLVHGGFMKSWLAGGFNTKVITRVMDLVNMRKPATEPMQIYVAGKLNFPV